MPDETPAPKWVEITFSGGAFDGQTFHSQEGLWASLCHRGVQYDYRPTDRREGNRIVYELAGPPRRWPAKDLAKRRPRRPHSRYDDGGSA
jgi:hypothetical protein